MPDVSRFQVLKLNAEHPQHIEDEVVVEEPLEVRVNGESLCVTMRTPGNDFDLAAGMLWTEGIVRDAGEIGTIAYCENEEQPELRNVVNVTLTRRGEAAPPSPKGRGFRNSSCGLCGRATLEEIRQSCRPVESTLRVSYDVICTLPARLRAAQANFDRTGGIHAAGLFDPAGNTLLLREDLGRHNAVDKVLGAAFLGGDFDFSTSILVVSGRLGFEIAQKALVAGIPVVASVSAPSSLAIELARDFGITAVGFLRGRSMNIYTHSHRVLYAVSEHLASAVGSRSGPHNKQT
ncbi:MAG: formate dehydrogenase accessory sulfurtransferase FdhD [Acidobacteria bacterium]|nr:formate dehydrogenase accessory sulfurtransferase FdhD [Acidobacteriota bacterium]